MLEAPKPQPKPYSKERLIKLYELIKRYYKCNQEDSVCDILIEMEDIVQVVLNSKYQNYLSRTKNYDLRHDMEQQIRYAFFLVLKTKKPKFTDMKVMYNYFYTVACNQAGKMYANHIQHNPGHRPESHDDYIHMNPNAQSQQTLHELHEEDFIEDLNDELRNRLLLIIPLPYLNRILTALKYNKQLSPRLFQSLTADMSSINQYVITTMRLALIKNLP